MINKNVLNNKFLKYSNDNVVKYDGSLADGSTNIMKHMTAAVVIDSHHFDIFHIENKWKVLQCQGHSCVS